MRRGAIVQSLAALLLQGLVILPAAARGVEVVGFSGERRLQISDALVATEWSLRNCEALRRYDSDISDEALRILREETVVIGRSENNDPEVCGHTASRFGLIYRIQLTDQAFSARCFSLSSTLFHELLHLTSFWLPEETIQDLQLRCLNSRDLQ